MASVLINSSGKVYASSGKPLLSGGGGVIPSGSINITSNGTYDVTLKESAVVNVPQGTARSASDITVSGAKVTVPAGLYSSQATKTIASGTTGTPIATKGSVYDHSITITPSVVNETGYIIGGTQTGEDITVDVEELVSGTKSISSNGNNIDVADYKYVNVSVAGGGSGGINPSGTLDITTNGTHDVMSYAEVDVNIPTGPSRSSSNITVSGASVTIPAGLYSSQVTKTIDSGTAGTPTAAKSSVSNNSITVTPSVTNTTGYITGGTKTGTGVSVAASELVSGTKTITTNGSNIDVTNYKYVTINVAGGGTGTGGGGSTKTYSIEPTSDTWKHNDYVYIKLDIDADGNLTVTKSSGGGTANNMRVAYPQSDTYNENNVITKIDFEEEEGIYEMPVTIWWDSQSGTAADHNNYTIVYTVVSEGGEEGGDTPGGGIIPSGTIDITENGIIDITTYASANVNVPTGDIKTSSNVSVNENTVTIPAGLYETQVTKTVQAGTAGTPTASKGSVSDHSISITPSVTNTTGYISGGTKSGTAVSVSASELVSGNLTVTSNNTYDVTNYKNVIVNVASGGSSPSGTINITTNGSHSVSEYATANVNVPTGTARSSTDLTASGATVTVPAGLYSTQATKTIGSGSVNNPTASKGTVSNHSITVTPSVTSTTGYITGGTKNGTGVSVSASELVSGDLTITENGTHDVTNYKNVIVNISGGGSGTGGGSTSYSITPTSATFVHNTYVTLQVDIAEDGTITATKSSGGGTVSAPKITLGQGSSASDYNSANVITKLTIPQQAGTYTETITVWWGQSTSWTTPTDWTGNSSTDGSLEITYTVVAEGGSGGGDTPVAQAKNIQVYHGMKQVNATSLTSTDISIEVEKTGTYKISWMSARSANSGTYGSQLYIGTTAYGTENTTFTNTYGQSVTLNNVSLTEGQTVTVYARAGGSTWQTGYMMVGNLIIEEI